MGPGSRIEIHQDRHNSNLQRITIQMKLFKRNYFFFGPSLFSPRTCKFDNDVCSIQTFTAILRRESAHLHM